VTVTFEEIKEEIDKKGELFAREFSSLHKRNSNLEEELKALREKADLLETVLNRPYGGGNYTANGKPPKSPEVKAFDKFVRGGERALDQYEAKSLLVGSDPDGGYLALGEYSRELLRLITAASPMRQVARATPIGGSEIILPKQTRAATATWLGEISETPQSQPAFGQARIIPHRLSAYVEASQQLLEDGFIDIDLELNREFAEEFARAEGEAFTTGDGVQKPKGFLTLPAGTGSDQIEQVPSGHATELTADAMITTLYKLPSPYRRNATWLMNSNTLAVVRKMKDSNNRYLWDAGAGGLVPGQPETILGRPVVEFGDMPDLGAGSLSVAVGDWQAGYRIVDRIQMSLIRDIYTKARNAIVCFHATRRVGGDVVRSDAIKLIMTSAA
jgi:HK97 family phage major capsid protein